VAELRELATEWGPVWIDGEPSAHPDFPEILGPEVHTCEEVLATNGFGFARATDPGALFPRLSELGYWGLSLTLHGVGSRHDCFVGRKGAYRDILTASARALQGGFRLHWNIYLDRGNLEDVPRLVELQAREFPGSLWVGVPFHVVSRRMWRYERLRPSASDIAARLPNLRALVPKTWPRPIEEYTEARWLEQWKTEAATPAAWPPTEPFEELLVFITRDREVYLSPECAPRVLLGTVDEGKAVIEARLRESPAPVQQVDPWTAEAKLGRLDLLHHTGESVRHKAVSAVYYWGRAAARKRGGEDDG
jgi:MoaA/NifB/PqqE/SkfB family radical SAM enzyme